MLEGDATDGDSIDLDDDIALLDEPAHLRNAALDEILDRHTADRRFALGHKVQSKRTSIGRAVQRDRNGIKGLELLCLGLLQRHKHLVCLRDALPRGTVPALLRVMRLCTRPESLANGT